MTKKQLLLCSANYPEALQRNWEYLWNALEASIGRLLLPLLDSWKKDPDLVEKKIDLALKKFEEEMLKK